MSLETHSKYKHMDNVGYVEEDAFSDCTALKQIVFSTEIFSIKNAFVTDHFIKK